MCFQNERASERAKALSLFGHWPNINSLLLWVTQGTTDVRYGCVSVVRPRYSNIDMINVNNLWVVQYSITSLDTHRYIRLRCHYLKRTIEALVAAHQVHWITNEIWKRKKKQTIHQQYSYLISDSKSNSQQQKNALHIRLPISMKKIFIDIHIFFVNNMKIL